jgi:hypothetical protein
MKQKKTKMDEQNLVLSGAGANFTVNLHQSLDLTHGDWQVALLNFVIENPEDAKKEKDSAT